MCFSVGGLCFSVVACRSQLIPFSVQAIAGDDFHLEGLLVAGVREQEGVETLEVVEVLVV